MQFRIASIRSKKIKIDHIVAGQEISSAVTIVYAEPNIKIFEGISDAKVKPSLEEKFQFAMALKDNILESITFQIDPPFVDTAFTFNHPFDWEKLNYASFFGPLQIKHGWQHGSMYTYSQDCLIIEDWSPTYESPDITIKNPSIQIVLQLPIPVAKKEAIITILREFPLGISTISTNCYVDFSFYYLPAVYAGQEGKRLLEEKIDELIPHNYGVYYDNGLELRID